MSRRDEAFRRVNDIKARKVDELLAKAEYLKSEIEARHK